MGTERERLTCQRNLDLETSTTQSIYKMNKSSYPNPQTYSSSFCLGVKTMAQNFPSLS